MSFATTLAQPLLRRLDPELAHDLSLRALRFGLAGRDKAEDDPILAVNAFGRVLPNPIGLAAGFDKNAVAVNALGRLGFGFIEAGTVTPCPQPGNARPRLFRLAEDAAVINRMGFNNAGIGVFTGNLARADRAAIAIGANVGINKQGANPLVDYPALVAAVSPLADYVTINISSPNTPGLRDLQSEARLTEILQAVRTDKPLFVKIAPDLAEAALETIIAVAKTQGIAGLIISNTTITRPDSLRGHHRTESGGLSGAPLFGPSTAMLARAHRLAGGRLILIGAGGVATPAQVFAKILAGASLVQIYTGFAYGGPALIPRLKSGLADLLRARGFACVGDAVGAGR
ncbi:MAG: quinone-dependent dihydroorotate dehydrogenase [Acidocella sp.]|nr:quinone-dependent dihydroorotate dehydrogenase [Acidocella sp.]